MTERNLSNEEIMAFQRDGVALLPQAVAPEWIARLLKVADQQLANPSEWGKDGDPEMQQGRMFTDRYLWRKNDAIYDYIKHAGCARLAGQAMQCSSTRFYFDHLIVKQPNTNLATPWHQDVPYWPFLGKQICSIWLALTPTTLASSTLEFVRASHLDDVYYLPARFGSKQSYGDKDWLAGGAKGTPCPDIEAQRDKYDIVSFDLQPGDALIFSAWTLHGAPGNSTTDQPRMAISTRWLGDDAIWSPRPGADPSVNPEHVQVEPGQAPHDNAFFPELWHR
jgi:ectoine hydroxylase-related dioxygenase (phytanoyl-CoA dioxygenase family)